MTQLPAEIQRIAEFLAIQASGYGGGNRLHRNEVQKMIADLRNRPDRWYEVDPVVFREALVGAGMRLTDADTLASLLAGAKSGNRLLPKPRYRYYSFQTDAEGQLADEGQAGEAH